MGLFINTSGVAEVDDVDIDEIINKSRKEHELAEDETLAKIMEETANDYTNLKDYIPDDAFVDFVPNTELNDMDSEDELEAAIQLSIQPKHWQWSLMLLDSLISSLP